ncbi:DNA polymerase IV [Streptomyces sp. NPDC092296]|uniref:DNA polymerase IV n=1 Tax=Streptomyces sp. NPDC092296 TaxID=3366012 RepID=UPI003809B748
MRPLPTILHLDMDAFYASAEQASKPSLRGKPVVVGGLSGRGVVATASYEARRFGVHSAMAMAHARRLCPNAAFLVPRFELYRQVSETVMGLLRQLSPLVEPLSLDEAFVDLAAGPYGEVLEAAGSSAAGVEMVRALGEDLRADIRAATGLTGSVGLAGCKLLAKIASEEAKPDGLFMVEPGRERAVLDPLPVRALPGVGPATAETLRRMGLLTVAQVAATEEAELVRLLGRAHGVSLHAMALGLDDRPVVAERDAKSVSVEDTFEVDLVDRGRVLHEVDRLAERCVGRLRAAARSGRTVVVKVRRFDFSTLTRSETLRGPTDDPSVIAETARRLIEQVDIAGGVRLLGVGVSGLADFTQEDLFAQAARVGEEGGAVLGEGGGGEGDGAEGEGEEGADGEGAYGGPGEPRGFHPGGAGAGGEEDGGGAGGVGGRRWLPGQDVQHEEYGPGWVQGSGVGRVTVRFETPGSAPGRVRTFPVDDPELRPAAALPLTSGG